MDGIGNIILFGVPAVVLIPIVVQAAKSLGMPTSWAPWVTLGLSVVVAGVAELMNAFPGTSPWVYGVVSAIVLYLSVTGLYSTSKNVVNTVEKKEEV